jgi:hypothetical protein
MGIGSKFRKISRRVGHKIVKGAKIGSKVLKKAGKVVDVGAELGVPGAQELSGAIHTGQILTGALEGGLTKEQGDEVKADIKKRGKAFVKDVIAGDASLRDIARLHGARARADLQGEVNKRKQQMEKQ